ncbi:MAG: glucose-1-phosphate thymidylyltransferase RfbA [Candidatus Pacebacteria bacterium]|nr:glucose-1-phosphate thymidylyltransferase RfbA [Candidatus Paceibacterota bacterium]
MKGIILAGGSGTRLYPVTKGVSKQLLPIYDKPMIYYPLSILMLAGIRDILVISTKRDLPIYEELLSDGNQLGMRFEYKVQKEPKGIPEAFIIGEEFIGRDNVCLVLGDNMFYGTDFINILRNAKDIKKGAMIFGYYVKNPNDFGIVEIDSVSQKIISIEEKPQNPKSNYAIVGLYFCDNDVIKIAKAVKPSPRGELEIISVLEEYLRRGILNVKILGRGTAWLDTGTHKGLLDASNFVEVIQNRQGLYIACIEEIAYRMGFINREQLIKLAQPLLKTDYGKYLIRISETL